MIATAGSTKTHIMVSCKKQKDCEQLLRTPWMPRRLLALTIPMAVSCLYR